VMPVLFPRYVAARMDQDEWCGHVCCRGCFLEHVRGRVEERKLVISCPVGCNCRCGAQLCAPFCVPLYLSDCGSLCILTLHHHMILLFSAPCVT
jgi:hypothetical protein